jgi:hypothetical protein
MRCGTGRDCGAATPHGEHVKNTLLQVGVQDTMFQARRVVCPLGIGAMLVFLAVHQ